MIGIDSAFSLYIFWSVKRYLEINSENMINNFFFTQSLLSHCMSSVWWSEIPSFKSCTFSKKQIQRFAHTHAHTQAVMTILLKFPARFLPAEQQLNEAECATTDPEQSLAEQQEKERQAKEIRRAKQEYFVFLCALSSNAIFLRSALTHTHTHVYACEVVCV